MTLQSLGTLIGVVIPMLALAGFMWTLKADVASMSDDVSDLKMKFIDFSESRWRKVDMVIFCQLLQERADQYAVDLRRWSTDSGLQVEDAPPALRIPDPLMIGIQ